MRSVEKKEILSKSSITFEFHKGNDGSRGCQPRTTLGKPTPSKWDDAQKWLVGLSKGGGDKNISKTKPRNSNADDTRLIAPVPQQENEYLSGDDDDGEVEKAKHMYSSSGVRSVCVRDMGTEMTPIASKEPSRSATPIRATTPVIRSPISSGGSTPMRCPNGVQRVVNHNAGSSLGRQYGASVMSNGEGEGSNDIIRANTSSEQDGQNPNPLNTRAMAWDEAERAKYMARYKREEVKIQAWENHEKRKAEMEMKKMEAKVERLKSRTQEKYTNKLAASRRIAEEKRATAETKLNEKVVKTSEKADYIRRTGHLPSSPFCFKIPSFCRH